MQCLGQPSAGCRRGVTAQSPASTSGRSYLVPSVSCSRQRSDGAQPQQQQWQQQRWRQQRRPQQSRDCSARITNTNKELEAVESHFDPEEADYVEMSQMQIPNPELGPLEQRVSATYEDATLSDDINAEDTKYWFNPPEEGWNTEVKRIPKAQEVETELPTAHNPGEDRTPLDSLIDGQQLTGLVTRMMLYHGAQIDMGTEYDGLIPIQNEEWTPEIMDALYIDTQVTVRIHKKRDPSLYRWPLQLELLTPADAAAQLPPPEAHVPALDLRGRGDLDELCKLTGRDYHTNSYWTQTEAPPFDCIEDAEPEGTTPHDIWAPEVLHRISDIACSL